MPPFVVDANGNSMYPRKKRKLRDRKPTRLSWTMTLRPLQDAIFEDKHFRNAYLQICKEEEKKNMSSPISIRALRRCWALGWRRKDDKVIKI